MSKLNNPHEYNSESYDSKFSEIFTILNSHAKFFDRIENKIDGIYTQTKLTNGKVIKHEEEIVNLTKDVAENKKNIN